MARILFLSVYDDVNIGVRVLSRQLSNGGHDVHGVFFKMPAFLITDAIPEKALCYEYTVNNDFVVSHYDASPWTPADMACLVEEVRRLRPDVVALSARSWFDSLVGQLIGAVREGIDFSPVFIAGGYGPAFTPEEYLKYVDYVFIGESEDAMLYFADHLHELDAVRGSLKNVAYLQGGQLVIQNVEPLSRGVSHYGRDLFLPDASLIQDGVVHAIDPLQAPHHKYFFMAGRGCVGSCSYCSGGYWRNLYPTNVKQRRNRTLDSIFEELDRVRDYGFEYLHFVDEFFIFPYRDMRRIFDYMAQKVRIPFFCYLHPKMVTDHPDVLKAAADAGLTSTIVAVQSGSEEFSKTIYNRRNDYDLLLRFSEMIHAYPDIQKTYHFITGNPLESEEDIFASFDYIKKLPFNHAGDTIHAFKLNIFPQSPLGDLLKGRELPEITTRRSAFLGFMHYARLLLDDAAFHSLYREYESRDPFELQARINEIKGSA